MKKDEEYLQKFKAHLNFFNALKERQEMDEERTESEDRLINKMIENENEWCKYYLLKWYDSDEQISKRKQIKTERIQHEVAEAQKRIDEYNLAHLKRKRGRPKKNEKEIRL